MKSRPCLVLLASALAFLSFSRVLAQAPASMAAPAAPAPVNPAEAETKALFDRMAAKIKSGQNTEQALSGELAEMDALIAKYSTSQPEDAASVLLMKAGLYLQVFENPAKTVELLKKLKVDFPASKPASRVDGVVASLEAKMAAESKLAIGSVFPTFSETGLDGQPLDLATFKGKVVLVDFWATWCGPCVRELPNVIAAYGKYHDKGFEIVGVSLDKDRDAVTAFIKEHNMPWRQYFDGKGWENKVSLSYGIDSIPATYLLDADGKILAKDLRGEDLDKKLATLLKL